MPDKALAPMIHQIVLDKTYCHTCENHLIRDVAALPDVKKVSIDHDRCLLNVEITSSTALSTILPGIQTIIDSVRPCPGPEKIEFISDQDHTVLQQDIHCHACEGIKHESNQKEPASILKWIHIPIGILGWILTLFVRFNPILSFVVYLASFLVLGYPVLIEFFRRLSRGKWLDENALMSIASIGAFGIREYSEAMAVMLFYQIGEWLEERAALKSRKTITSLLSMKPESVCRIVQENLELVPADKVNIGDILLLKPGQRVPLDGVIASGSSDLDTSTITGESLPRNFQAGDTLYAGYINLTGTITLSVTKNIHESMISRILTLVDSSLKHKTKTEKFITRFAAVYTPIVVTCAFLVAILSPFLFHWSFQVSLSRALVFLVVSCPCALIISIPLTLMNGLGAASKQGVMIKGTQALENIASIHTLFFDKTGTITEGKLKVRDWFAASLSTQEQVRYWMEIGEYYSNHPIAKLFQQNLTYTPNPADYQHFKEIPGKGIIASYQHHEIVIGHQGWLEENGVSVPSDKILSLNTLIAVDKQWIGGIIIEDAIKPDTKLAIQTLKKLGIRQIILLSGDQKERVQAIAKDLQVDQAWSELLPEDKVNRLVSYQNQLQKQQKTAFVGDGVNDAPVIARSDIGIAMGALGSEAAIEASDIVIMEDKLMKLPNAIQIAKKTRIIVWQNILLSLIGKGLILILGLFGHSSLWMAVFGDVGIALIAILNSIRVFYIGLHTQ